MNIQAVQGTFKSLLQHHSLKASILWCSAFFYSPTLTSIHDHWKTIALTGWTFVSKVMSLLFNMLSRLVIAFLPRSKCLLISWLQSPSAVILELKKIKSVTVSIVSPSICHRYNMYTIHIYHWLDGCEFGWTPGDGDGQGGLVCCESWGQTWLSDWTELNWYIVIYVYNTYILENLLIFA